jgi:hypothetical protein
MGPKMIRFLFVILALTARVSVAVAQPASPRLPVIDMHVHSTNTTPEEALSRMKLLNIRFVFVAVLSPDRPAWAAALKTDQFLPAIGFPCPGGKAPFVNRRCWDGCLTVLGRSCRARFGITAACILASGF